MYLSENARQSIRKCFENQKQGSKDSPKQTVKGLHDSIELRKLSQILFDARDGKHLFKPL